MGSIRPERCPDLTKAEEFEYSDFQPQMRPTVATFELATRSFEAWITDQHKIILYTLPTLIENSD